MNRNILLVEPGYKTKFPPLGLMKISTYHKNLGDNVHFVKGYSNIQSEHGDTVQNTYWDRIYISTLFTFNWKVTVDTIKWYKWLVKDDSSRIFIGGILASLMPEEIWNETGLYPHIGLLNNSTILGDNGCYSIDNLPPDYSLFDSNPNQYSLLDSYMGYSTRGCIRKCSFCGVQKLEPNFVNYIDIKPYVNAIENNHGTKQHLILLDNNVLASDKFKDIIRDIQDLGFYKGAKINNRLRHVDFNQGVDARLLTEGKIKLLATIPINPLRIAFDNIKDEKRYTKSVHLAAQNNIRNLSNYILYNFKDTPEDFWQRLKINIELNKEYDLQIYSFPMKYMPLTTKDRSYIDKPHWNWQYLRGVQRILNVLKGAVMCREDFFNRAFGETEKEFIKILYMPERILMHRTNTPQKEEIDWNLKFVKLSENEKKDLLNILCTNRTIKALAMASVETKNKKIKDLLHYYVPDSTDTEPSFDDLDLE
jgi:hypothetical protein